MNDLSAMLRRKVGPFPIGVWLLIAAAGVGLGLILRRSLAPRADLPPIDAAAADQSTPTPAYFTSPGAAFYPQNGGTPFGGPESDDYQTNNEWVRYAVRILSGRGTFDALALDTALRLYVQGEPLTQAQAAMVTTVLRDIGPAPEPVPPMRTVESPTTPTPGAPAAPPATPAPAPTSRFSPAEEAWLSTVQQVFATIRQREAAGQNYADQFPRLAYLGVKSSAPELSDSARGWYRTYLTSANPGLI